MTIDLKDTRVPFDVVKEPDPSKKPKPYRLWCKTITPGNPVVVLVHGAVVPLLIPNELHDPNKINSEKYGFYNLDSLLYYDNNFHYNVFTFEYANWPILPQGNVNYHAQAPYGECLIEAIGIAKEKSKKQDGTAGPVYVIAHSMGGLVARYAVQDPRCEKVSKIITLDTGHRGFGLAKIVDDLFVDEFTRLIPTGTLCSMDVASDSHFVNTLNAEFATCPPLVSIAALDPVPAGFFVQLPPPGIPPGEITVVDSNSSNMGQVYPLHYNHVSIAQIKDPDHAAYKVIKKSLS